MSKFCVNCGTPLPDEAGFCPKCGAKVEIPHCPSCGKEVDFETEYCIYCGARLKEEAVPEPLAPETPNQQGEKKAPAQPEEVPQQGKPVPHLTAQDFSQDNTKRTASKATLEQIVEKNTAYYLPQFEQIEAGQKGKFNWAAFFLGGFFCFYRRSGKIFWKYCKWAFILMAVILVGTVASAGLAINSVDGIMTWAIVCGVASLVTGVVGIVCAVRCGKNFNQEYYSLCVARADDPNYPVKKRGVSVGGAILFWLVLSVCSALAYAGISAVLLQSLFGGLPSDPWDLDGPDSGYEQGYERENFVGRWTVQYLKVDGEEVSQQELEEARDYIYLDIDEDGSFMMVSLSAADVTYGTWEMEGNGIKTVVTSTGIERYFYFENGLLCVEAEDLEMRFQKESDISSAMPSASADYVPPRDVADEIHQYVGQAEGFGGTLTVQVSMQDNIISKVEVIEHNETEAIGAKAIGPMVEKFAGLSTVEAINAVDCVSGATMTSEGIKQAVINALAPVIQAENPIDTDRSTWEYDDYVKYYGFDPADYGYVWYNSMRSGPLEDFFAWVAEEINGGTNTSRLYEISDPWEAELTPDDFVGTWQTDGGIVFSIENSDGDYTIDLSENEGLGMLGGWFTYALYNVEDQFCGMSGENGVTSFSVSYGYSTDYPTSTWLELVLVNSEGIETRDYVSLY